jgi:hypothetical protein
MRYETRTVRGEDAREVATSALRHPAIAGNGNQAGRGNP